MENYDECFDKVGRWGSYQLKISIIIIITSMFGPILLLTIPINQMIPEFSIRVNGVNGTESIHITDKEEFCKTTYYDQDFKTLSKDIEISSITQTWSTELKFVCNTKKIFSLIGTVFFLGNIASNIAFNKFPDRYGRKRIFLIFNIISFVVLFQIVFLKSYVQILICAFIMGITSLNLSTGAVLINETINKSYSGTIMGITNAMFPFVGLLNLLLMGIFQNWRVVYYFIIVINLTANVLGMMYLRESPEWLNANKKYIELLDVFNYIAECNGTKHEFVLFLTNPDNTKVTIESDFEATNELNNLNKLPISHKNDDNDVKVKRKHHVYSVSDLFLLPSLRWLSINSVILWIISGFSFFGILLNLEGLTGSIVIDSLVTYIAEFIAEILSGYLAYVYGSKKVLFFSFVFSTVGTFSFLLITPFSKIIGIIFLFIASLGIASAFNIMYIYSPQIFPTNIKTLAVNTFSLMNRIAAGLVPTFLAFFPFITFVIGLLCALGSFITLQVPDSTNYKPGDEVEEINDNVGEFIDSNLSEHSGTKSKASRASFYLEDMMKLLKSP